MDSEPADQSSINIPDRGWRLAAIAMLAVRFVQGWIYWGGATRRFIYGPQKLDVHGHWMAYKFQTAMPGALLGTGHAVAFLLRHFTLLYSGIIIFSGIELVAGLMLLLGFYTRLAALGTIGLSTVLMLLFGWQGATCIDEWTMASSNFAMGITLLLAGSGIYSIDSWRLSRRKDLTYNRLFRWCGGALPLPINDVSFKKLALILFWASVIFVVGTYDYYRGSVVTPFHGGPVSPKKHNWKLSDGKLMADGSATFSAYINAGTPAEPSNILKISLVNRNNGKTVEEWNTASLVRVPAEAIQNSFPYQKIHIGRFGIVGPVGARGIIHLAPAQKGISVLPGKYELQLVSVNSHKWSLPVNFLQ